MLSLCTLNPSAINRLFTTMCMYFSQFGKCQLRKPGTQGWTRHLPGRAKLVQSTSAVCLLPSANCWAIVNNDIKETLHKNPVIYQLNHIQTFPVPCSDWFPVLRLCTECVFPHTAETLSAAISSCKHRLMWPKRIWKWAKTCTRQTESN